MFGSYLLIDDACAYFNRQGIAFIDIFTETAPLGVIIYTLNEYDSWAGEPRMFTDSIRYDRVTRKIIGE